MNNISSTLDLISEVNYLAIEFLEIVGNEAPTQEQIDLVEDLLSSALIKKQTFMHQIKKLSIKSK
ncbi:MAG: hypothetical protein K0S27_1656 [Gammaproteobacteria bacterium]|jgi:hypothetical protein|nr:hypothetical protein [Gammaproteobacteria bacterium]